MTFPPFRHENDENNDAYSLSDITEEIHRTDRTVSNESKQQPQQTQEEHSGILQHRSRSTARQVLLTFTICTGLMFSCLDTSIVSTALVSISLDLGDAQDAPWTILGYLLTYMSFAVGFSKLSDIYGRRNLLAIAWVFFSGFSVWCALAGSMKQLIAARALQGIGGSGLYSLAQVCLLEQGPSKPEMVGALVGITLSISYVLGPLLGGGISAGWTWRGIFWINVPCGALALIGIYSLWPDDRRQQYEGWTGIRKIDFIGNLLLIVASILLVFSVQEAGSYVWKWSSPVIIWSLVIAGLSWVLLGFWETYLFYARGHHIQPIFPVRLATGRVYLSTIIVTFLTGFVYIALVIKIPERFQVIYGDSALRAGIHLLPMLGSCAFGSTLAGTISKKRNLTSHTLAAGNSLQVVGLGLVYGFSHTTERGDIRFILGFTAIYGFGVGLCFAACTMIAAIEARHGDLAAAQGAIAQVRVLGGSLGLGICTIIFNAILRGSLAPATEAGEFPRTVLDQLHRSPLAVFMLPPEQQALVKIVYSDAFRFQMLLMTAVAALAVLASAGTYRSKPPAVVDTMNMIHQKELAARPSDTELESASSVRSLVRGVS